MSKTFNVAPDFDFPEPHIIGNKNCDVEWCGAGGFPMDCNCGGLIHACFGDENMDCDYWLYQKCDRCGDSWKPKKENGK